MAVKKVAKKASKKRVTKKKVSKVSSNEFSVQGFEPIDRESLIESLTTDITDRDTKNKICRRLESLS